jgi:hypothetical protein
MKEIIEVMDKRKVDNLGNFYYKTESPDTLRQTGWKIKYSCEYLVERMVSAVEEQLENGEITLSLAEQLGMVEGQLTKFRDSMSEGDIIVTQQIGFLLMMIELGKVRLGKLRKLTITTKIGEGFVPLVKDVQSLIKDAVTLMDNHGWTTAGKLRMIERGQKSMRSKALDMLEGKDGSYALPETEAKALPEPILLNRRRGTNDSEDEI